MTNSFVKWQLRAAYIKVGAGAVLLTGLIVGYLTDTTRPPTFYYIPIGATAVALLFWSFRLFLLLRDRKTP